MDNLKEITGRSLSLLNLVDGHMALSEAGLTGACANER